MPQPSAAACPQHATAALHHSAGVAYRQLGKLDQMVGSMHRCGAAAVHVHMQEQPNRASRQAHQGIGLSTTRGVQIHVCASQQAYLLAPCFSSPGPGPPSAAFVPSDHPSQRQSRSCICTSCMLSSTMYVLKRQVAPRTCHGYGGSLVHAAVTVLWSVAVSSGLQ